VSKTAYPTGASGDLMRFLVGAGMIDDPPSGIQTYIDLDSKVADARAKWENTTGYKPFLGATQTRYFDPPGPHSSRSYSQLKGGRSVLWLDTGLVSVTSVTVDTVAYTQTAPGSSTLNDYWLEPANAPDDGRPYEQINFWGPVYGLPNSVVVVGTWGFGAAIPDDAFQGMLNDAAAECTELPGLVSRGLVNWKRDSITQTFGENPLGSLFERWGRTARNARMRYKRDFF
jgi:hypothetical protein